MLKKLLLGAVSLVFLSGQLSAQQVVPNYTKRVPIGNAGAANGAVVKDSLNRITGETLFGNIYQGGTFSTGDITSQLVTPAGASQSVSLGKLYSQSTSVYFLGAVCNGVASNATTDTNAINAVLNAKGIAGGGFVDLPNGPGCMINATLHVPAFVHLRGQGNQVTHLFSTTLSPAMMVSLDGQNSSVEQLDINPLYAGQPTSGTALSFSAASNLSYASHVDIGGPCNGIDMNGNNPVLQDVNVNLVAGSSCNGIRVGNLTTFAVTTDAILERVNVSGNSGIPPESGLKLLDVGGILVHHISITYTGTKILPGTNQQVIWSTFSDSYLGDTTAATVLTIDTGAATSQVKGLSFVNDWASSSQQSGVIINNTAGGLVDGVHFVALRVFANNGNGFVNNGGLNVSLDASNICGIPSSATDVVIGSGMSVAIRGSHIGGTCDGQSVAAAIGILLQGSNSGVILMGNDLSGPGTAISGNPTNNSVVTGNTIAANQAPAIATAATIALANAGELYILTGTTTVNTMTGGWNGRKVTLLPQGAVTFTGGNMCIGAGSVAAVANRPVLATYMSNCWAL